MTPTLELSAYLDQVFGELCQTHCPHLYVNNCKKGLECKWEEFATYVEEPSDWRQIKMDLSKSECALCDIGLVLGAVDRLFPLQADEWMEQPNTDLRGRTPLGCLMSGDFQSVINALWLHSDLGPVS